MFLPNLPQQFIDRPGRLTFQANEKKKNEKN